MSINNIYSIVFFLILLIIIVAVEMLRKRQIDFLLIFNITYALFFSIVPIILILSPELLYYDIPANWAYHFSTYSENLLIASLYALLFYIFFILIYKLINKKSFISYSMKGKVQLVNQDVIFMFGIAFLFIGVTSFFIYSTSMGGPVSTIVNAQLKRSGVFEATGVFTFFKHFMKSVYFGLFVFLTVKPKNQMFKLSSKFLLAFSIFFTIIVLLAYSGRANILILLLTIVLYKNIANNKSVLSKKQMLIYGTFIILFGLISAYYRPFMLMLSGRDIEFQTIDTFMVMYTSIIKAFAVPITSLALAIEKFAFHEISVGMGFYQVILDVIPKSIINPEYVYLINNLNTELFGYSSIGYNIPAGLLAYFYYEFHWIGILIGSAITAIVMKVFDDLLRVLKVNPTYGLMMTFLLLNIPNRILAGDQVGGVKSNLILIIEFLILLLYAKSYKSLKNEKKYTQILRI